MERNTVERVTEWGSEPFSGGHAGLREFADREFTGAVTDGAAWLFMLNGRVVGVFDGDLSQFDDADGTAYVAPDRSLPLLFAMQETGDEVRGEYYTEETPLSEVDRTLQSGNFTGYVELSENVLSGDYYLVYYGGRRLPVAFVGNQERRLTGDEAFERADDEVGIYRVKTVDLEITDVPEPTREESTTTAVAVSESDPATATDAPSAAEEATPADNAGTETEAEAEEETTSTDTAETEDSETAATEAVEPEPMPSETSTEETAATERRERGTATSEPEPASEPTPEEATASSTEPTTAEPTPATDAAASERSEFEAESEWQGTTTIPALDPAESVSMEEETPPAEAAGGVDAGADAAAVGAPPEEVEALRDERDRLRDRVEELEAETERLGGERDRLERERDEAAATADELEDELEELRATVDQLEAELEAAEADLAAAEEYIPEGDHEIGPEEAMRGTSLFVRYEREGGPTLENAHNGEADRDEVNANVRLERHTEFEDEGALVDGEPFDEWLRDTIEYGFVNWLTKTFVHDIRETRNQTALGKLFDAIPDIDRIEFRGSVDLGEAADEEGDATTESAAFDVVLRDRMGQPLIVTDLNDSREPATEPMMESLIRNATPVGEANERLSGAFFVTSSYYEPGALETAEEATGGGLLSRGKNKSFVQLSRKDGYHLCLVETRDGEFHVSVPEL